MDSLIKHKTGCMICALIAMACIVLYWGASISSDAYVFENMDRCHVILFSDGGWMKIKIIDGKDYYRFMGSVLYMLSIRSDEGAKCQGNLLNEKALHLRCWKFHCPDVSR